MADTVRCEAGHENEAGVAFCAACGKPFPPPAPADANAVSGPTVTNEFGIEGLGPLVPMARGGQSVVYRASHPKLNRTVAVKVLTDVVDDGAHVDDEVIAKCDGAVERSRSGSRWTGCRLSEDHVRNLQSQQRDMGGHGQHERGTISARGGPARERRRPCCRRQNDKRGASSIR